MVNPDDYVDRYGADTFRCYLMFIGPWDQGGPWDGRGIEGVSRFLRRALSLTGDGDPSGAEADPAELPRRTNRTVKKVTEDLEAFRFNTAIAALMEQTNYLLAIKGQVGEEEWGDALRTFALVLAPFAPHHAEEMWAAMGEQQDDGLAVRWKAITYCCLVILACLLMPQVPAFWTTKLLFAATGAGFALIKVSVFATIGLITNDSNEHASFMNFLESFFMIGVLSGYFLFSAFVDDTNPQSTHWLTVYYVLAGIALAAFLLLLSTPIDESSVRHEAAKSLVSDLGDMLRLALKPVVLVFIATAFVYVLMEQGIMSWLPTFNSKILKLPTSLSIEMASILAASTAAGRFVGVLLGQTIVALAPDDLSGRIGRVGIAGFTAGRIG